jgi:iron complex outermembrane receptor protein
VSAVLLSTCVLLAPTAPAAARPSAQGSQALKQLTLEALGNIEVTSTSKEPETLLRTPAPVYVLTSEDIRRSGATSLPEALRLVPGLQVARMDSDHWAVGVRGFANQFSQSLLVLIDGRSVYTPLFAGVYWSLQDTLLEDIDRIEVVRGPGGTIWGANAVNGVINIITKRAADTRGLTASVGGGNVDHSIAGFRYGGARGSTFDYRVYAKAFKRGPEFHSDGHAFDDWQMAQGGFRTDWSRNRDGITVQGDVYNGRNGQSISIGTYSPPAQSVNYDPMNVSGGNLLAQWHRELGNGDDIQLHAYYDRTYLLGPQIGESRNTFDVDFIHQVTTAPRQRVIWGLGARVSPSEIIQTVATLDVLPHNRTNSVYSAFGQDEITLVANRLWLTVGSKLERNDYTGVEIQPNVRVLWAATSAQSVWGGVTRAVRTPSRLESDLQYTVLLAVKPPTFLRIVGNPDFLSERLIGYEAGYRSAPTPQFYVDVAAFHNDHDNLQSFGSFSTRIEALPAPAHVLAVLPYANGVAGTSDGFEIAPDWQLTRAWQVKGSYSYLRLDLKNKPGNADTSAVDTYEGSAPRHQGQIRSMVSLPKGWQFDQVIRYSSALPAQHVDEYVTADVRVGWQMTRRLGLSVVGQNLTRPHHVEFAHSPSPSVALLRTVYATATWNP